MLITKLDRGLQRSKNLVWLKLKGSLAIHIIATVNLFPIAENLQELLLIRYNSCWTLILWALHIDPCYWKYLIYVIYDII